MMVEKPDEVHTNQDGDFIAQELASFAQTKVSSLTTKM
jgi:hypothetical protein